ncbi:hypothetical protein PGIGA_G00038200 [Pangasianodon gigas]|uniref:Uncharacterized protein n=1 Tax=Pangasianodon gigas TaxID=30993 RepID=A0ACC5X0F5_PANGG|nr:hypothetical protein [Pangasianodon gigas]
MSVLGCVLAYRYHLPALLKVKVKVLAEQERRREEKKYVNTSIHILSRVTSIPEELQTKQLTHAQSPNRVSVVVLGFELIS